MTLPYIDVPPLPIGPLTLHMFGLLVATGVVVGSWIGSRYAERYEIDVDWLRWAAFRFVVGGFIICHIIDVVFYQPDKLAKDPLLLLKIWQGISSYGGFIGGLIMFLWYTQKRYGSPVSRLELGDCAMYGFAPGFWFGRMACSTAHDHLGLATDFPLAVQPPVRLLPLHNGNFVELPRAVHDLGLYEALFLMPAIVLGLFVLSRWKGRKPGLLIAWTTMAYAVPRFFFEFLRKSDSDPRYIGLTPAQYFSVAMFVAGAYVLFVMIPKQAKTTVELASERRLAREEAAESGGAKKKSARASSDSSKDAEAELPKAKAKARSSAKPRKSDAKKKSKKKRK